MNIECEQLGFDPVSLTAVGVSAVGGLINLLNKKSELESMQMQAKTALEVQAAQERIAKINLQIAQLSEQQNVKKSKTLTQGLIAAGAALLGIAAFS